MGRTDLETCGRTIRWTLYVINTLVLVGGIAILVIGIWTLLDKSFIEVLLRNNLFMSSAYIMIISGSISIFISIIGLIGAAKETKCLLLTYFILLFLMFVVLLVGGVIAYVFRHQVANTMRPEMLFTINEYDPNKPDHPITSAWDDTQSKLKCCGLKLSKDGPEKPWEAWLRNTQVNSGDADKKVPKSCCITGEENLPQNDCHIENPVNTDHIYQKDCFAVSLSFVTEHATLLGTIAVAISCVMILGMVLSLMLFKLIE